MTFPVYLHAFGHRLHPHLVMEVIAYSAGFQLYRLTRRRFPRSQVSFEQNLWLIVGAIFGALIGSKLLAWLESFPDYWTHRADPMIWLGGKTIVGGLLGGWAGVEVAKKLAHIRHSTGDAFVFPLILGQCLGRVGCFLTGLNDHTYGNLTTVPWSVNFGDGPRHPTQLYEIAFLLALGGLLWFLCLLSPTSSAPEKNHVAQPPSAVFPPTGGKDFEPRSITPEGGCATQSTAEGGCATSSLPNGALFRLYLLGYLLFRFFIEFLKPTWKPLVGLSPIQIASLFGSICCLLQLLSLRQAPSKDVVSDHEALRT